TFAVSALVLRRVAIGRHWLWVQVLALGVLSPLVNSWSNYVTGIPGDLVLGSIVIPTGSGDVRALLRDLPPAAVHAWFLSTCALYLAGFLCFGRPWAAPIEWIRRRRASAAGP